MCALETRWGRGSPQGPARGGVTEKLSAIHTAAAAPSPLPPPRPLPFTAPGPPCQGLLFAPGQPAFPLLLSFTSPPPTPTPESRVLQCPRSRTYNLLSVSARNAAGLSGKRVLSIYSSVCTSYVCCSYSRGNNCFPLFSSPHWWLPTRIWEWGALPPVIFEQANLL